MRLTGDAVNWPREIPGVQSWSQEARSRF
ncbi:hypothetical protein RB2501_00291 [Robiginitalea biformata HTCC2501]|uniref:Uncharacterized protein n=1 Tax=Robiginitalea biformata (strain ATCC BAA-864 / DSM 15991 / KCTC 12146 / HTCC2501) TaxID=313596 RepID=A4CNK1_ROBBH|nr:hypothetical protein RB2501_00291 [Robiginitalea biformata HTCC2501]